MLSPSSFIKTTPKPAASLWQRMIKHQEVRDLAFLIPISFFLAQCKVWMHSKSYSWQGFSPDKKHLLHVQEQIRQVVSNSLWIASTVIFYLAMETFFKYPLFQKRFREPGVGTKLFLTTIANQIPDTFIRPPITAWLTKHIMGTQAALEATQLQTLVSSNNAKPMTLYPCKPFSALTKTHPALPPITIRYRNPQMVSFYPIYRPSI